MQNLSTNRSSRDGKGCFEPDEIAELPDMYVNCHMGSTSELVRPDSTEVRGRFSLSKRSGYKYQLSRPFHAAKGGKPNHPPTTTRVGHSARGFRRCWRCQSTNYTSKDCPQGRETRRPARYSNRTQVNVCAVLPPNCQAGDDQSASTNNACNRVLCDAESISFCAPRGDAQWAQWYMWLITGWK